jgi:hypothetical protein
MGVRISHDGVVVRNYFRTYKLSWPEVRRFADGSTPSRMWALNAATRSGLAVTATSTATEHQARADMVTTIRRAAGRYGLAADVRGMPAEWGAPTPFMLPYVFVLMTVMVLIGRRRGLSQSHTLGPKPAAIASSVWRCTDNQPQFSDDKWNSADAPGGRGVTLPPCTAWTRLPR